MGASEPRIRFSRPEAKGQVSLPDHGNASVSTVYACRPGP